MVTNNQNAFLALVRAGLCFNANLNVHFDGVEWDEVYQLAEEQSVVGLVAAGMDKLGDTLNVPLELKLQIIGEALQIEQRNKAMNGFIAKLVERMREADIYTLLVKGQGIAQCYEKPLWRASGDVDLLLSDRNYQKAKEFLLPIASDHKPDERYSKHLGMNIGEWYVEIHGTLRTGLSERVDREVDAVQKDVFYGGKVRPWVNNGVQVFLPAPDEDVFFVFTHFIKHFYKEGMSLRQLCDWCRLLYTYRDSLNFGVLESWIQKAGLMEEWRAFASLAVDYLGMQDRSMPLYDERFKVQGSRLMKFVLGGYSGSKVMDTWQIAKIFPYKALRYSPSIFLNVNWLKVKERMF